MILASELVTLRDTTVPSKVDKTASSPTVLDNNIIISNGAGGIKSGGIQNTAFNKDFATEEQSLAGTSTTTVMSPATTKAVITQMTFSTLADNNTIDGKIVNATAGENVVFGNICYFKSDGKFWKANATVVASSKGLIVMAVDTILADASGSFLTYGLARNDTWDWTSGAELFLSTTAGELTATAPSGNANIVRIAGYARSADYVWFDPDKSYVEVTV